jgi:hypothetical protein
MKTKKRQRIIDYVNKHYPGERKIMAVEKVNYLGQKCYKILTTTFPSIIIDAYKIDKPKRAIRGGYIPGCNYFYPHLLLARSKKLSNESIIVDADEYNEVLSFLKKNWDKFVKQMNVKKSKEKGIPDKENVSSPPLSFSYWPSVLQEIQEKAYRYTEEIGYKPSVVSMSQSRYAELKREMNCGFQVTGGNFELDSIMLPNGAKVQIIINPNIKGVKVGGRITKVKNIN